VIQIVLVVQVVLVVIVVVLVLLVIPLALLMPVVLVIPIVLVVQIILVVQVIPLVILVALMVVLRMLVILIVLLQLTEATSQVKYQSGRPTIPPPLLPIQCWGAVLRPFPLTRGRSTRNNFASCTSSIETQHFISGEGGEADTRPSFVVRNAHRH
jgi:energy-coupling factor transporter transmembrane protein EcfT